MSAMPSRVAQIRRDTCPPCDCQANPLDPCATCPLGNWGPWTRCHPDQPTPDHAPGFPVVPRVATPSTPGPGTILKEMLARILITPQPGTCQCNARAAQMDANGPAWCEANLDLIIGWLQEEATRRKLPFSISVARLLIRRAIKKARGK